MDGRPYRGREFALSLRKSLMQEHFACESGEGLQDPLSDSLWNEVKERAKRNTEIYREIFACDPDDSAKSVKDLLAMRALVKGRRPEEQREKYEKMKELIRGHTVEWPTRFLEEEDLQLGWLQVEGLLPEKNFI